MTSPYSSKMPVPRLPLEVVLTAKDGSTPRQPLTCGSDRSCVTRAHPTQALPDTPGEGTLPHNPMALPLPPLQIGATITPRSIAADDPQNTEPWSPQSLTGFFTPRADLSLDKLTLASPPSGSLRTPLGSPLMSPHSTKSPSMMSPMRMVGTRSPCSIKLSGGSSTHLGTSSRCVNNMRTSGGTPFTSPRGGTSGSAGTGQQAGHDVATPSVNNAMRPVKKPSVSRALPFTQPTPAAEMSAQQTKDRFQLPHLNGRELSFSDLLDPTAKGRAVQRMYTTGTTMPLSFINAVAAAPTPNARQPTPLLSAPGSNGGGRGGIPTSPVKFKKPTVHTVPSVPVQESTDNDNGQITPRKRPRKNIAPQRADFGNDDTCGGGSGAAGGSSGLNESSHGETSNNNPHTRSNNANNNNAMNNGVGAMVWEKDDCGTSPLKKNLTSSRTSARRKSNNNDMNNGGAAAGSDLNGAVDVGAVADADGGVQRRALHKRDHQ
jgi:hypothetical protein